jgi:hypothetical protein
LVARLLDLDITVQKAHIFGSIRAWPSLLVCVPGPLPRHAKQYGLTGGPMPIWWLGCIYKPLSPTPCTLTLIHSPSTLSPLCLALTWPPRSASHCLSPHRPPWLHELSAIDHFSKTLNLGFLSATLPNLYLFYPFTSPLWTP